MAAAKRPDYKLAALNKQTGEKSFNVGCAWRQDDGRITVKIDHFVVLQGSPNLFLTLFPNDQQTYRTKGGEDDNEPPF